MDKFFEENSKLKEEEIEANFSPNLAESLINQKIFNIQSMINDKLNKSKVMRVTKREEELLLFFRNNDIQEITKQLKNVFMYSANDIKAPYLKDLIAIIGFNEALDIELLLKNKFITMEQLTTILNAIYENKNIIITGKVGVGKTVLMNVILNLLDKKNLLLMYTGSNEFNLTETCKNSNDISILSKNISMEDISNPNYNNSLFVIDEISNRTNMLTLLTALNTGKQIFTTAPYYCGKDNIKDVLIDRLKDDFSDYVKNTLNSNKFVVINVEYNDNNRYVSKIEEI